jgi:hypothetical protein
MSKVVEFFGHHRNANVNWAEVVANQQCPYLERKCLKNRKSEPDIAIGTCTVDYGTPSLPIVICPHRFRERQKVFLDCIPLMTLHQPGNDLLVTWEVNIPGGSVDYFVVSRRAGRIVDFVGLEFQTLDTTGTVWPERQLFLQERGIAVQDGSDKPFGMNWKMTAKTILVQVHHKIATFEHLGKHLVLAVQDHLVAYMRREFNFAHIGAANVGNPMHFFCYGLVPSATEMTMEMKEHKRTDSAGIATCHGLQAEARVDLDVVVQSINAKIAQGKFSPLALIA